MDREELEEALDALLNPEPDEDGLYPHPGPHDRLQREHGIDCSYYDEVLLGDTSTMSPWMRKMGEHDALQLTMKSISVPATLCWAAVRLFADSIVAYAGSKRRQGGFRFYPSVLMTFWAGFESWVRIHSEILVESVPAISAPLADALLERRWQVEANGTLKRRPDRRPVLDRYSLLLQYGAGVKVERGSAVWQAAQKAVDARDALVHYDTQAVPSLTANTTWAHLESIMLLWIASSAAAKRTLFYHQYMMYFVIAEMLSFVEDFEEQPLHKDWASQPMLIYVPFDGVDEKRFERVVPT